MSRLQKTFQAWRQDRLLGMVIRNSGHLFSGNTIGTALSLVQSIFAAKLLGVENVGVLGVVTVFASTVNRLFSFRMGELVVKYMDQYRAEGRPDRAAAVVKVAALTESITSLLAFVVLVLLAPLAAQIIAHDPQTAPFFLLYGLIIPGNLATETATGVLQVARRFRAQAFINIGQSVLTAVIIVSAWLLHGNMLVVVLAYTLGKLILGIGPMVLAWDSLGKIYGAGWWRASFRLLPPRKELASFAVSTNLSATLNMIVRDSELLWVGFFLTTRDVGYYKIALAIINLVVAPINPLISATYPELSRSVAEKSWAQLRRLLRRVSLLAAGWSVGVSLVLLVFGNWVILLYGAEYLPAYPALMVLLAGYGVANILFWNRSLLLVLQRPTFPFQVMLWIGLAKVLLAFVLVPRFGYIAEAALLSAYLAISVAIIVWQGLRQTAILEGTTS
ncbi:MAG TPA: oligosaccharide flippase family protein [Anaerolineaceae bacterium]